MAKKVVKVTFINENDELADIAVLEGLGKANPNLAQTGQWAKAIKKRRANDPKLSSDKK